MFMSTLGILAHVMVGVTIIVSGCVSLIPGADKKEVVANCGTQLHLSSKHRGSKFLRRGLKQHIEAQSASGRSEDSPTPRRRSGYFTNYNRYQEYPATVSVVG